MNKKHVLVLEITNSTEEQIQEDFGNLLVGFCDKHKDVGITTSVLNESGAESVLEALYGEDF